MIDRSVCQAERQHVESRLLCPVHLLSNKCCGSRTEAPTRTVSWSDMRARSATYCVIIVILKLDANPQLAVSADVDGQPELPWVIARRCVENTTRLFDVLMGPDREPSLLHSLPSGAMHRLIQHVLDLYSGVYDEVILGGVSVSECKYDADAILDGERVKKRFFNAFKDCAGI